MSIADVETIRPRALSKEIVLYLGVAVAMTLGHGGILALPFEVGAMVDGLKLDVAQAGLLASAGLVPFAAVQFLLAEYSARLPLRRVAVVGTVLIMFASFLSATALSLWLFAGAQIVSGLGFGLVYGISSIAGVRARVPEKAYGLGLGATTVAYAALLAALPRGGLIVQRFPMVFHAHSGVFIVIAAFALILLPFMGWVPSEPMIVSETAVRRATSAGRPLDAALATLVMILFSVAVFCVYVYIERRGRALGVDSQTIGSAMSVMYVVSGVAGSALAALLGMRWGLARPLVVGLSVLALTCLGTAASRTPMQLWISVALNWFIWFFLYGYLFGLSAALDPAGRLPAVLGAMYLLAAALATMLGGLLLKYSSFGVIGWFTFTTCILAAILAAIVGGTVDRLPRERYG